MRLASLFIASIAFFGLAAFQDPAGRYKIDFPDGWTISGPTAQGFTFANAADKQTNCGAKAADLPGIAAYTPEQINSQFFTTPFDAAAWASILGTDPANVTLVKGEIRDLDGHKIQIATVTLKAGFENIPFESMARIGMFVLPGRIVLGSCLAETSKYPANADIFEKTVSSLRPL